MRKRHTLQQDTLRPGRLLKNSLGAVAWPHDTHASLPAMASAPGTGHCRRLACGRDARRGSIQRVFQQRASAFRVQLPQGVQATAAGSGARTVSMQTPQLDWAAGPPTTTHWGTNMTTPRRTSTHGAGGRQPCASRFAIWVPGGQTPRQHGAYPAQPPAPDSAHTARAWCLTYHTVRRTHTVWPHDTIAGSDSTGVSPRDAASQRHTPTPT